MNAPNILIVAPLMQDQYSVVLEKQARVLCEELRQQGYAVELDERGAIPPVGYRAVIYLSVSPNGLPRWPVTVVGAPAAHRIAWCLDWREYTPELSLRHAALEQYAFQEIDEAACAAALMEVSGGAQAPSQASLSRALTSAQFDEVWTSTEQEAAELRRILSDAIPVVHVGFCSTETLASQGACPAGVLDRPPGDLGGVTIVGPVTSMSGHLEVLAALAGSGVPVTILHPGKVLPADVDEGLRGFSRETPHRLVSADSAEDEAAIHAVSRLVVSLDPSNLPIPALERAAHAGRPLVVVAGGSFDLLTNSRFLGVQPADWRGLLQLALLPLSSWRYEPPKLNDRAAFISKINDRLATLRESRVVSQGSGVTKLSSELADSPGVEQLIAKILEALRPQERGMGDSDHYRLIEELVLALQSGLKVTESSREYGAALLELLKRLAASTFHGAVPRGLLRSLSVQCAQSGSVESHFLLEATQILIQAGDLVAARYLLDRVLRVNPRDSLALILCGSIALGLGRPQQAEAVFNVATHIASDQADAWTGLGCAKLQLGNRSGAQQCLERALSINPGHSLARQLMSMFPERSSTFA